MGNGQSGESKDINNQYNFYDTQLNEYKRMIIAQQEQINQLSKMNLKQNINSRTTSNMFLMNYIVHSKIKIILIQ